MPQFSDRLERMEESATLAMSRRSRELMSQGKDIISLSLGEPDFDTPQFVKDAAIKAMDQNYTHYTPVRGYPELLKAISEKFKRDNNLDYKPSQIVVSTGAKQSIANLMLVLINPGDEVLLPVPYWVSYVEIVKLAGGIPIEIPSTIDTDFKVSGEMIEKYITPKTKAIVFSSPCNPSGSVYSKAELKGIAEVIKNHKNITIISDEIYEFINFSGQHESIAQFDEVYDQTVTVNGMSKAWAMTGWRIGYIGAPESIANACDKMQGQFTSGANSIAQRASIAALKENPAFLKEMQTAFYNRRAMVKKRLEKMEGMQVNQPEGAFYFFPNVSNYFGKSVGNRKIENADDLSMYLLEEGGVAVVSGTSFGNENCLRISYSTDEKTLEKALDRMEKALKKLQ